MNYDKLKDIEPRQRPKMLGLPWTKECFQGPRLFIFMTAVLALIGNGMLAAIIRDRWTPLLATFIALPFLAVTHLSVCSGFTSSNTGTYFRDREPIRFWLQTVLAGVCTAFGAVCAWLIA
jgi:hypothetical protein